jgi:hypothetical protein
MTLNSKELKLLERINEDSSYSNWFFRQAKHKKWFFPLKDKGYFVPTAISLDEDGHALFWPVLDYLERLSEQTEDHTEYAKELIEIIDNLVKFSSSQRKIDNYHIWWYCVKITNNLPSGEIKKSLSLDQFKSWLQIWTDHSMGVDLTISDIGKKLLPKFLSDDYGPDYEYANIIIYAITQIKSGGNVRGITKREDARMEWDAYWINQAFNKHGDEIGRKCSSEVLLWIADQLRLALQFKQKNYYANIEISENEVYRIWVGRIEDESCALGFKDNSYSCVINKYTEDQLRKTDRETDFWALHKEEPSDTIKRFEFMSSNKKEMFDRIKKNLPDDVEWEKDAKFIKKIDGIYEGLFSDYSHIWCRSLANGVSDHASGAEEVLATIFKKILLSKCENNIAEAKKILGLFLEPKYDFPIFKRFILLCVDMYWEDCQYFLKKLFELMPNVLEESDLEVELYDVLLHHNSKFDDEIKDKIKVFINAVPEYYLEEGEKPAFYWKFKWLSPLKDNEDFISLYEEAKDKAAPKDGKDYMPERSTFKGGFVTHKSPFSKEEISKMPVAEIIKYLNEFKGADFWHGTFEGEPDKEGLADVLQSSVKDEPNKFIDALQQCIDINYFYLHRIIRGIKDAWNEGKDIDWEKYFTFCVCYLNRGKKLIIKEALSAQGEDSGKGRYLWIIESLSDLIADGSKDDKRAFDAKYFDQAEKVFDLIIPFLKGEAQPDTQRDALTYALNTTLGRTVMNYLSFSLRVARANQKKQKNWGNDKFERFLPIGIDGYIWMGSYLPQINYMDTDYAKTKINYFSKQAVSNFQWQMFMEGYLTGTRVYKDLYGLMRENYKKGISCNVFDDRVDKRLVEHICVGYLNLGESLSEKNENGDDSLFWKILMDAGKLGKPDRWMEIAGFFWSITGRTKRKKDADKDSKEKLPEDHKNKIMEFWRWTFNNPDMVKENLKDEYEDFLGRMAELTIILDRIGEEEKKWLLLSAPHVDRQHRSTFFIEYLAQYDDDESVIRIGRIFKKMLENTTPTFRKEDIETIVRKIYVKGKKEDADYICTTYGRRGIHFLRSIWKEFNK